MTTIQDILTYADGRLVNGRVVVNWPPFQMGGTSVAGGMQAFDIVDGVFHVELYPNANAKPLGMYYSAAFELEEGAVYTEYWMVPNLPTVTLGQVRIAFPITPSALINAQQLTSAGATYGQFLGWDGTHWVPMYVTTINVSPNTIGMNLTGQPAADLAVSGSPVALGQSMVLNVPDAGPTSRGVVTTGAQAFAGQKTFQANVIFMQKVGIGAAPAVYPLEVTGDVNLSPGSSYRVNGVPIPAGHVIEDEGAALPQRTSLDFAGAGVSVADDAANNRTVVTIAVTSLVTSVFTRTGAVVAKAGDYTVAQVTGAVPESRQIIAGAGLSGGGSLAADLIFQVLADTTVQRIGVLFNGAPMGTRPAINFIAGANVTLAVADDPPDNRVNVTITAIASGAASPSNYEVNGALIGLRSTLNLISGPNITLAGVDNGTDNRVDITITSTGGGAVSSVFTRTGAVVAATGDYTAAQVTNAVSTLGSYADPAWITSLAWSKITGAPTGGAVSSVFTRTGAVVAVAGDYTAAQVTNAVSVLGSYADPAWITSLAWAKITGAPAGGSQTPWTSNIDAASFALRNVGLVAIGNPGTVLPVNTPADSHLIVGPTTAGTPVGEVTMCGNTSANGAAIGVLNWANYNTAGAEKRVAAIVVGCDGAPNSGKFIFYNWSAGAVVQTMLITSAGLVGIGAQVTTPGAPLHVLGNVGGEVARFQSAGDSSNARSYVTITTTNPNYWWELSLQDSNGGGTTNGLAFLERSGVAAVSRVYIASGGNVGIGTQTPTARLEVAAAGATAIRMRSTDTIGNNLQLRWFGGKTAADLWAMGTDIALNNGSTDLNIYDMSLGTVVWFQSGTGRVGIRANPAATLEVDGPHYGFPAASGAAADDGTVRIASIGHGEILDIGTGSIAWLQARNSANYAINYPLLLNPNGGQVGIGTGTSTLPGGDPLTVTGLGGTGGQLRLVYYSGGFGVIHRNDGSAYQILMTAASDPYGVWAVSAISIAGSGGVTIPALSVNSLTMNGFAQFSARMLGWSNSVGSVFTSSAIELRQTNQASGASGDNNYAPRISFHWVGLVASQIGMDSGGNIRTFDNPGTGYANFACGALTANGWNGFYPPSSYAPGALSCVVPTDANGYINCTYINTSSGDAGVSFTKVYCSGDSYIRWATLANFAATLRPYLGGGLTVQNNVTASRARDVVYQNSTGKAMLVSLQCYMPTSSQVYLWSDGSANPGTVVSHFDQGGSPGYMTIMGWVLAGQYYKMTIGGTVGVSIGTWMEWS